MWALPVLAQNQPTPEKKTVPGSAPAPAPAKPVPPLHGSPPDKKTTFGKDLDAAGRELKEEPSAAFYLKYHLQGGLGFSPSLAIGSKKVADSLGFSLMSFRIFSDLILPQNIFSTVGLPLNSWNLGIRGGLEAGISGYPTADIYNNQGSSTLVSFLPYVKILYPFKFNPSFQIEAYTKLGAGAAYHMASVDNAHGNELINDASIDFVLSASLGILAHAQNIKNFAFFYETQFMGVFEQISGQFLVFSLGALYKF